MAADTPQFDPPNRTQRAQCWSARDAFFGCLDKHDVISGESRDASSKCGKQLDEFRGKCSDVWVKYFQDQRLYKIRADDKVKELEAQGAKRL